MPRLPVALTEEKYAHVSLLAKKNNDSMSNVINELIDLGMESLLSKNKSTSSLIEQHCQQLIIQMSVLIKNMSEKIMEFDQKYFDELREAVLVKFNEFSKQ